MIYFQPWECLYTFQISFFVVGETFEKIPNQFGKWVNRRMYRGSKEKFCYKKKNTFI